MSGYTHALKPGVRSLWLLSFGTVTGGLAGWGQSSAHLVGDLQI